MAKSTRSDISRSSARSQITLLPDLSAALAPDIVAGGFICAVASEARHCSVVSLLPIPPTSSRSSRSNALPLLLDERHTGVNPVAVSCMDPTTTCARRLWSDELDFASETIRYFAFGSRSASRINLQEKNSTNARLHLRSAALWNISFLMDFTSKTCPATKPTAPAPSVHVRLPVRAKTIEARMRVTAAVNAGSHTWPTENANVRIRVAVCSFSLEISNGAAGGISPVRQLDFVETRHTQSRRCLSVLHFPRPASAARSIRVVRAPIFPPFRMTGIRFNNVVSSSKRISCGMLVPSLPSSKESICMPSIEFRPSDVMGLLTSSMIDSVDVFSTSTATVSTTALRMSSSVISSKLTAKAGRFSAAGCCSFSAADASFSALSAESSNHSKMLCSVPFLRARLHHCRAIFPLVVFSTVRGFRR
mmetsp:Transcript_8487/g.10755  ORF Transcript_8487/g.10755 Transcript_8487/m.10755 type:complete len:420 (-) Transcript_8487:1742-3001(-)